MRTVSKIIATLVAALVALTLTAATAQADVTKSRKFTTAGKGDAGYATARLKVKFNGPKKAKLVAKVNDICPKNGKGAYLRIRVHGKGIGRAIAADDDGCTSAPFSWKPTVTGHGSKINRISAKLCERDMDGGGRWVNCTKWKKMGNPYA